MTKKFSPKKTPELESVYVSTESKAWIKDQAKANNVSMVAIVDEMVAVCTSTEVNK